MRTRAPAGLILPASGIAAEILAPAPDALPARARDETAPEAGSRRGEIEAESPTPRRAFRPRACAGAGLRRLVLAPPALGPATRGDAPSSRRLALREGWGLSTGDPGRDGGSGEGWGGIRDRDRRSTARLCCADRRLSLPGAKGIASPDRETPRVLRWHDGRRRRPKGRRGSGGLVSPESRPRSRDIPPAGTVRQYRTTRRGG